MTSRSKQLGLDDVTPGMVLSDDLLDAQGHILLAQGITLSEATITALRRHDIEAVPVLCEAPAEEDAAAEIEQHRRRLARLFRKYGDDEASKRMRQYVTQYRTGEQA